MKGKDGKYLNPEAAAEANARMQMGMALWTSAFFAVKAGKFTVVVQEIIKKIKKEKKQLVGNHTHIKLMMVDIFQ